MASAVIPSIELNEVDSVAFVDVWERFPVLWDSSHRDFKNKRAKAKALDCFLEEWSGHDWTPEETGSVKEEEMEEDVQAMPKEEAQQQEENQKEEFPRETIQCELCQLVVQSVDKALSQNRTEAAVQKALDEVCQLMPDNLQTECLSFVDQYGSIVVELLLQELQPQQVCTFLSFCQQHDSALKKGESLSTAVKVELPEIQPASPRSTDDENSSHNSEDQTGGVSDGEACLLCQTLANFLKEALNQQSTQDEVEKLLEDICSALPSDLTATCDMIVEQFTPLILQLLSEKDDPLEICKSLGLCSQAAHAGRLEIEAMGRGAHEGRVVSEAVGVDACTYGPSFWCANMDNARQCGMVQECVEKYGMEP